MRVLAFDLKGKLAHFRRPDTTATHMTYPFITPTAAKGVVGAILGIEDFITSDKIGIQLLHPVMAVAQQMSMLGKDGGPSFNRPTTMELLINPAYRIYYSGDQFTDDLLRYLNRQHAVYPTYLGSAYALTKPVLYGVFDNAKRISTVDGIVRTKTIVPTKIVGDLVFEEDCQYSRAGGFLRDYKGKRTFEKSMDFIYERGGKSISFKVHQELIESDVELAEWEDETVCLF